MKLAVFSSPEYHESEELFVQSMMREGLEYFHLRKPGWTEQQIENYLKKIDPQYYRKIVIHGGFGLIRKYNLKGMHLGGGQVRETGLEAIKPVLKEARRRGLNISSSVHAFEELPDFGKNFSHLFLSPVFDSISKQGYKSGFNLQELNVQLNRSRESSPDTEIWGLGGISSDNMHLVYESGFSGAAVLGAIWGKFTDRGAESALEEFLKMKKIYNSFHNKFRE